MDESEKLAALYAALAAAQGEFLPIEKNREVTIKPRDKPQYTFRYADLEEILRKTRPALTKHGLAIFQTVETSMLTCMLAHSSGGTISSHIALSRQDGDPKALGAAITYMRRYLVAPMLGVAADDDLDEDGQEPGDEPPHQQPAGQKPAVAQPQRRQAQQQPAQNGDSPPATPGEVAYITKKIEAAGLTVAQARDQAGIAAGESLDGLTKAEFAALKGVL